MRKTAAIALFAALVPAAPAPLRAAAPPDSCLLQVLTTMPAWAPVTVVQIDSARLRGYLSGIDLRTGVVSLRIGNRFEGELREVPRARIARFERRLEGGRSLTAIGAVVGALIGALAGASLGAQGGGSGLDDVETNVARGVAFGGLGALAGAGLGALLGQAADQAGGRRQVIECPDAGGP